MTTIAYKNGIVAADSRVTVECEAGGHRVFSSKKLFRKTVEFQGEMQEVILATAGESAPGMLYVDWFGSGRPESEVRDAFTLGDADFTVLIVTRKGLFEVDKWCRIEPVYEAHYAIGSGTKLALGAMDAGRSAKRAVEIACGRDPYTAGPVVTMRLTPERKRKPRATPPAEVTP